MLCSVHLPASLVLSTRRATSKRCERADGLICDGKSQVMRRGDSTCVNRVGLSSPVRRLGALVRV